MAQQKQICLASLRMQILTLAFLSGLRIWYCHELWRRSQMRLGSGIAVAVAQADNCSSDWTPSLGNSIYRRHGPKKTKTKQNKKKNAVLINFCTKLKKDYLFTLKIQRLYPSVSKISKTFPGKHIWSPDSFPPFSRMKSILIVLLAH